MSIICKIELLGFVDLGQKDEQNIKLMLNAAHIIDLNNNVVDETIKIRKKYRIKLPDAIIAASALSHQLTLISRNIKDFRQLSDIKLINPYS